MSETLKLRTATFGGFNRQDVVDYIESTAREHTAQLNALRAELKDVTEKLTVLEGEKARADALTERCATLTARVDELAPLEQEVETLRGQVETYRPQAESFAALKDTVANIELDARTRASQLVQEAETEAQTKRRKAEQLLDELMQEYSTVGQKANTAITDVICKLTDLRASLANLGELQARMEAADHE